MSTFVVKLGRTQTSKTYADFTLELWDISGVLVDETGWSWTELGQGMYLVDVPNYDGLGGSYHIEHTATGSPWNQGELSEVASVDLSGVATSAEVLALGEQIDLALSTATPITTTSGSGSVGTQLVNNLFTQLRAMLKDDRANAYKNQMLVPLYNRVVEEINSALMQISSELAMDKATFIGDGENYTFVLPSNFLAFVPSQVRPRSPATATSNYTMGKALDHSDQFALAMTQIPTTVQSPSAFVIIVTNDAQYIKFNTIPVENEIIDALYYYKPAAIVESAISSTYSPWLGLLDSLILRMLEHYCREGLEFTNDARALWVARTMADAAMLLGLRHLQTNIINPSTWGRVPRR